MSKFLKYALTLTLIWISSFQIGIAQIRDTTQIVLSTEVARKVAEDLIEGDKAKQEVVLLDEYINLQRESLSYQDSVILSLERNSVIQQEMMKRWEAELNQSLIIQESLRGVAEKNKAYAICFGSTAALAVAGIITILCVGK